MKQKNSLISVNEVVNYFKHGKIVVYPTDTIYGLGCLATDKSAIKKILRIKKRDEKKGLIILVSSVAMAKRYCLINKKQELILKTVWPGKVTVIMASRARLPKELEGGTGSLAVRLPQNDFLIKIIKKAGVPIVSTSANISGGKPLESVKNIKKYFKKEKPDIIIDAGVLKSKPSKLIDIRDVENLKILR